MSLADISSVEVVMLLLAAVAGLFVFRFFKGVIKLLLLGGIVVAALVYLGYI